MNDYNDERFLWKENEITIIDSESNTITDPKQYLKSIKDELLTYEQKLKIGDVVSLKGRRYLVRVESFDYKLSDVITFDYVGSIIDFESSEPIFFFQYDIEKKYDATDSLDLINPISQESNKKK